MLPSTLFSVPVCQCHVEWWIPPWVLWTGMKSSSLSLDIMFMLWGLGSSCFRAVASLMQPKCVSSAWMSKALIAHWLALTFTRLESNFGESNTAKQRLVQELIDILIQVCEEIQQDTIRFLTRIMPRGCWDWMQLHRGHKRHRLWFQFWTWMCLCYFSLFSMN